VATGYALYCLMKGKHMSFNLNNFVNFMDQVKDKDWVDDHVIIDGVSPEFQKQIKDKIRERLKDDTPKRSKTKRLEVQEL
jgi:pantothenate kinase